MELRCRRAPGRGQPTRREGPRQVGATLDRLQLRMAAGQVLDQRGDGFRVARREEDAPARRQHGDKADRGGVVDREEIRAVVGAG